MRVYDGQGRGDEGKADPATVIGLFPSSSFPRQRKDTEHPAESYMGEPFLWALPLGTVALEEKAPRRPVAETIRDLITSPRRQ